MVAEHYKQDETFWRQRQDNQRGFKEWFSRSESVRVAEDINGYVVHPDVSRSPGFGSASYAEAAGVANQPPHSGGMDAVNHAGRSVASPSMFSLAGRKLVVHQRLVALAGAREAVCQQVHLIEEQKVQLAEQKLAEQQRLLHHLQLKLESAQSSLDGQLHELHSRCGAVERQMEIYGRILRGTEADPCQSRWQELEAQFQRLQQQQALLLDPQDFSGLLDSLRAPKGIMGVQADDLVKQVEALKRQRAEDAEVLEAAKREAAEARAEAAGAAAKNQELQLLQSTAAASGARAEPLREGVAREVQAVRDQYETALQRIGEEHERRLKEQQDEVERLNAELEAAMAVAESSVRLRAPGDRGGDTVVLEPLRERGNSSSAAMQMLREALGEAAATAGHGVNPEASGGAQASQQQQRQPGEREGAPGDRKGRIQGLLLEMQARSMQERREADALHRKEMQQQAAAHEEAMRGLAASHEEAMGRLTALLRSQPSYAAHQEDQDAINDQLQAVQQALEQARARMERMAEEFDSKLGYELYQERVEHERRLTEVRDTAKMQAASEVLDAQAEAEELRRRLREAVGADEAAPSRQELEQQLNEALAERDAALVGAVEEERARIQKALEEEHAEALQVREAELQAVLAELRGLREQHFASSSSGGALEESSSRGPGAEVAGPAADPVEGCSSPSLGDMGTASLLTLSPSRATASPAPREERHGGGDAASPAESVASVPQRGRGGRGGRGRGGGSTAAAEAPEGNGGGMSSLVAAILTGFGSRAGGSAPTAAVPDPLRAGRREKAPGGGSAATASADAQGGPGTGSSEQPDRRQCLRCGLNDEESPGACRFHPFLVKAPGPFLYGPEWHLCKASRHDAARDPGCYVRAEHYYSGGLAASLLMAAAAGGSRTGRRPLRAVEEEEGCCDISLAVPLPEEGEGGRLAEQTEEVDGESPPPQPRGTLMLPRPAALPMTD